MSGLTRGRAGPGGHWQNKPLGSFLPEPTQPRDTEITLFILLQKLSPVSLQCSRLGEDLEQPGMDGGKKKKKQHPRSPFQPKPVISVIFPKFSDPGGGASYRSLASPCTLCSAPAVQELEKNTDTSKALKHKLSMRDHQVQPCSVEPGGMCQATARLGKSSWHRLGGGWRGLGATAEKALTQQAAGEFLPAALQG